MMSKILKHFKNNRQDNKKQETQESDNLIKKALIGTAGGLGTTIIMDAIMILIVVVVVVLVIAAPLLTAYEIIDKAKSGIKNVLSDISSVFKSSGSGNFKEFLEEYKSKIDAMNMSSNEQVDEILKEYIKQLSPVYMEYKEKNIELDIPLITSTVFYKTDMLEYAFDTDETEEEKTEPRTFTQAEMMILQIRFGDIEELAENMISDGKVDEEKYKNYLIETYIPERFNEAYDSEDDIKKIAEEIIEESKEISLPDENIDGNTLVYEECSEVCTTDNKCYPLEEFVVRVVDHESGGFIGLTKNYAEEWKAQAVAARTYTIFNTNMCKKPIQTGIKIEILDPSAARSQHDKIKEAIESTSGEIMTIDGKVALAAWDSFYKGNNYHCDEEYCYATYDKVGLTWDSGKQQEIKSYKKWESYYAGGHGKGLSQYGAAYLADIGWNYKDILKYYYADNITITKLRSINTSSFAEGLLFPVGVNSKTGQCVSAGNYYSGGSYHGAVDIASSNMGYYGEHVDLPVIASVGGQIYAIEKNQWCTNNQYVNSDTRLPIVAGCQGNNISILVDDKDSKWYGYRFIYYHLDSVAENLNYGDRVEAGQFLGIMGSTGNSTGEHLHFGIKDPLWKDVNNYPIQDIVTKMISNYCANNIDKGD